MTFWAYVLTILGAGWAFLLIAAVIGAGIPVMKEKIRKRKGQEP